MKKIIRTLIDHKYLLVILLGGIALRVWHVGWSLPEVFEEATPFRKAWAMWNWGKEGFDFNPHFFNYPALSIYVQWIAQAVHYGLGHVFGIYSDLTAFHGAYVANPTAFIVIARLVTICFDWGTIVVAYSLGSLIFDKRAGFISAILVAVNPLLLRQAHTINVDTPLVFFSLLSIYFFLRIDKTTTFKFYVLTGVVLGCAMSSKYTGALLFPALLLAEVLRHDSFQAGLRSLVSKNILAAIGSSIVTFFLINPYIILDYSAFHSDFSFEQEHMQTGHLGVDSSSNGFIYYLFQIIPDNLGWLVLFGILASMIVLMVQNKKSNWILLSFPVLYFVVISTWNMRVERYILPMIPILMIITSIGIVQFSETIGMYFKKKKILSLIELTKQTKILTFIVVLLVVVVPLKETFGYHTSTTLPDTRTLAREWLSKHIAPKSVIATGPFGIKIPKETFQEFQIPFTPTGSENLFMFYQSEWFEDVDVLIASDYDYSRFAGDSIRYKAILPYYSSLRSEWKLLQEIKPSNAEKGPRFWIYTYDKPTQDSFSTHLFTKLSMLAESSQAVRFSEGLARIHFMKGKLKKSEQLLRFALNYSPSSLGILKEMIWVEFNQGKFQEAMLYAKRSLEIKPDQFEIIAIQGGAEFRLGMFEEAETTLNNSIRLNPRFDMPYKDLFSMYEIQKKTKKQIEVLQRYLTVVPQQSELAFALQEHIRQLEAEVK